MSHTCGSKQVDLFSSKISGITLSTAYLSQMSITLLVEKRIMNPEEDGHEHQVAILIT
jgi:hypothetical protein